MNKGNIDSIFSMSNRRACVLTCLNRRFWLAYFRHSLFFVDEKLPVFGVVAAVSMTKIDLFSSNANFVFLIVNGKKHCHTVAT